MPQSLFSRHVATILWLLVALLAAATATSVWQLSARQQLFFYVVSVGVVLLVSLNVRSRQHRTLPMKLMSGIIEQVPPPKFPELVSKPLPTSTPTQPASELVPREVSDQPLTATKAREWLDDFLVKQQKS